MNSKILSDQQILEALGERLERYRREQRIQDQDIFSKGGVKKDALASFKKGRNISLLNFIKILRGVGLLHALEGLIPEGRGFSPIEQIDHTKKQDHPARVHKKKKVAASDFQWGDE